MTLKTGMGGNRGSSNKAKLGHHVSSRTAPLHNNSAAPWEGAQARYVEFRHRQGAKYGQEQYSVPPCGFEGDCVCGVKVRFRGLPLTILSAYIRYETGDGADQLSKALAAAQSLSPFVYVGMDANGKSPLWGPGVKID